MIYEAQQFIYLPGHSRNGNGKILRIHSADTDGQFAGVDVPNTMSTFLADALRKRRDACREHPEAYGLPFAELKVWPDESTNETQPGTHRFYVYPTAWDVRTEGAE